MKRRESARVSIVSGALALLLAPVIAGCGGGNEKADTGRKAPASARPSAPGSLTVETLSFVPPAGMVRIASTERDVALEMSLGGATAAPDGGTVPPPGIQVFKGGRDLGGVNLRMELIKSRLTADAPTARFAARTVTVPGAAEAAVLESSFPEAASRQVDLIIGTASGPQYDVRYGAALSAFDAQGLQRILSSARILGGGS